MRDVRTRPAHYGDVDFLSGVFLASMRESITAARGHWNAEEESAQFRQQLELDGTSVIQVANVDVGFFMTRRTADGSIEVHTLCLAHAHQGEGVGTKIMHQQMRAAGATGSRLEVSVLKANQRAKAFYTGLGFVEVARSAHHVRMRWRKVDESLPPRT